MEQMVKDYKKASVRDRDIKKWTGKGWHIQNITSNSVDASLAKKVAVGFIFAGKKEHWTVVYVKP